MTKKELLSLKPGTLLINGTKITFSKKNDILILLDIDYHDEGEVHLIYHHRLHGVLSIDIHPLSNFAQELKKLT